MQVAEPQVTSRAAWRSDLLALGVLALLATLHVTVLELAEPNYFVRDDNAAYFLPVYVHTASTLWGQGELALLNFHQYLGQPHLAMGQTGVLYPPIYLAHGLAQLWQGADVRDMIFLLVLSHLVLAAAGCFVLVRSWGVPRWIAVGSGLLWVTFPFLTVVSRNWIWVAYGAAWVPWCLFFLDVWLTRGMRWALAGYAVAKAMFCFQGYAQYVILSVLFEATYVVLRTLCEKKTRSPIWWRRVVAAVCALAASGGLAAPLLLPMWQAKEHSQARAGELSLVEFLSNPLDPGVFARSQLFDVAERAIHQATGAIFYVGLPVLLVLLGAVGAGALRVLETRRFENRLTPHAAALVGALVVAFVLSTVAVRVLHSVPLLGSFRWPFKSFLWVLLFAALALAVILGHVARRGRGPAVLAYAALGLGIAGNLVAIHADDWDRPFGPNVMSRQVGDYQRYVLGLVAGPHQGRAVSMWMSHGQDDIERFLTHNYATLAGVDSLGGYEPLISRRNFDLAKGLQYSNIWRYELTRQSLDYLSEWSVRWLLMPDKPRNRAVVGRFPELRVSAHSSHGGLLVVENTGAAPYAFLEGVGLPKPLQVGFGSRGLRVDLGEVNGGSGLLRVQVAPLDGYEWFADGEAMGPIGVDGGNHIVLEIPEGTTRVDIVYPATAFRLGVALALITAMLGGGWLFRRCRKGTVAIRP